ncbi:TPA: hypothetical protein HA244_04025 [Candidatus Micrarchaeota archaeon]|nr:hypothetical protein [Candidatus Micrarchaeota archaeon]
MTPQVAWTALKQEYEHKIAGVKGTGGSPDWEATITYVNSLGIEPYKYLKELVAMAEKHFGSAEADQVKTIAHATLNHLSSDEIARALEGKKPKAQELDYLIAGLLAHADAAAPKPRQGLDSDGQKRKAKRGRQIQESEQETLDRIRQALDVSRLVAAARPPHLDALFKMLDAEDDEAMQKRIAGLIGRDEVLARTYPRAQDDFKAHQEWAKSTRVEHKAAEKVEEALNRVLQERISLRDAQLEKLRNAKEATLKVLRASAMPTEPHVKSFAAEEQRIRFHSQIITPAIIAQVRKQVGIDTPWWVEHETDGKLFELLLDHRKHEAVSQEKARRGTLSGGTVEAEMRKIIYGINIPQHIDRLAKFREAIASGKEDRMAKMKSELKEGGLALKIRRKLHEESGFTFNTIDQLTPHELREIAERKGWIAAKAVSQNAARAREGLERAARM